MPQDPERDDSSKTDDQDEVIGRADQGDQDDEDFEDLEDIDDEDDSGDEVEDK